MAENKEDSWPIRLKPGQLAKLTYGANFKMDELLMLELDEDILQEALDIGYGKPCVFWWLWQNSQEKRYCVVVTIDSHTPPYIASFTKAACIITGSLIPE
eukprot:1898289-Pyramimonas_sp.AAC.1